MMTRLNIAGLCALAILALPAQAATVTLDLTTNAPAFADGIVNNGDTVSAGEFSLTFQNVQPLGPRPATVLSNGVIFSRLVVGTLPSVELVFNIDTIIETYSVGSSRGSSPFQISGVNGTSGPNSFGSDATFAFDMGTIPVFLAGETYTLTHSLGGPDSGTLSALGLSHPPSVTAVPLPASLPLLLAGFGAVALLRRRAPRHT
ncbi:VPLPA-CTERM sorting domain-containing protein [Roseobacter sp. A03A-229]